MMTLGLRSEVRQLLHHRIQKPLPQRRRQRRTMMTFGHLSVWLKQIAASTSPKASTMRIHWMRHCQQMGMYFSGAEQ